MFLGEYQHTIDSKGRLIIPARLREGLGDKFIVTKGLDGCLFAYPPQEWSALEQKMRSLPFTRADARAFVRFFFAGATECEIDKQGRVLIPANLREYAGLEKEVVVIGVSSRVEIWSLERWERYNAESASSVEEIAEKIVDFDLGI
ncbi:division/cell wall cluster transcriptional repressor MraZ [Desulfallas sp. Bu1-1]|jgi:MraZ protein|uniref:division/cell wall cluster transcriptional repressor MraZ n=1 Tax=Desulfallas sp. Bu1-1 TaxID=2787620 RepID=UPI00189CABC4|nr:division/cell wall cluster transcriptional repressor MraZ [Desulfallas sp. Bu1-1]MBF7083252.1 division/cell wall cluster transcriptional repressor MraZ [Desulfallas sp. Bu1-1]